MFDVRKEEISPRKKGINQQEVEAVGSFKYLDTFTVMMSLENDQ